MTAQAIVARDDKEIVEGDNGGVGVETGNICVRCAKRDYMGRQRWEMVW